MDLPPLHPAWGLALLPVAARVGGLMLVAPVFGHQAVPARLRVLLALVVAVAAVGTAAAPAAAPPANLGELAVVCALELARGAGIGWAASLVFAGVELAAAHVAAQMGVSLGEVLGGSDGGGHFGPSEGEAAPVVAAYRVLAAAAFLLIGGHRDLLGAVLDTLRIVPVGAGAPPGGAIAAAAALLTASFVLALKVAAPVLLALLLATVALGLLHRALPGCHTLSTGLPARALLGLLAMALGLAGAASAVRAAWAATAGELAKLLGVGM